MGYTDTMLANGERLVLRQHQHWFILIANARYAILGLLGAILLLIFRAINNDTTGVLWTILGWITVILFVGGLIWGAWSILRWRNEEYIITTRRIIHAEGVVNKKATDSSLEKINDLMITESVFGRMFGFGDLDVLTASEAGIEKLRMLHDAKDFKKALLEAKHELEIELARPTTPPMRAAEPAAEPAPEPAPAPTPSRPPLRPPHPPRRLRPPP